MHPKPILLIALTALALAACTPQTVVVAPTLAVLPPSATAPAATPAEPATATLTPPALTATSTETTAPTATGTATTAPNSPTSLPATLAPSASPTASPTRTSERPTLTPSLTITPTLTLTPSPTLTPTLDVGGFSALADLAGRVTVQPPDVRYGPGTATALWAMGNQLAATARAGATIAPASAPAGTVVFAIVPGATLPDAALGTLPPPPGSGGGVCSAAPGGALGSLLASDPALAAQLGCATTAATLVSGAVQPFERGLMIYRAAQTAGAAGTIEALSSDGRFSRYTDSWVSGIDPDSAGLIPPPGLAEPIRGFGKVWRMDGALLARLGWALGGEQGVTVTVQPFERGVAIYVPSQNLIYVLADDGSGAVTGSWRQVSGSL